jgi:hypothetical protein
MTYYIACFLTVNSLLILWFYSPLSSTIGNFLFQKSDIYSLDMFLDILCLKVPILAKLLSCWICMSFWLSLITGFVYMLIFNLNWGFPILSFFTFPSILYLLKQLYR